LWIRPEPLLKWSATQCPTQWTQSQTLDFSGKYLPETNTLAYFAASSVTKKKEFYNIFGPAVNPFTDKRNFEKEKEREREREREREKCKRKNNFLICLFQYLITLSHYPNKKPTQINNKSLCNKFGA
jgi:hypothetical protein